MANSRSRPAGVVSSAGPSRTMPALLTRPSSRPMRLTISANAAFRPAGSVTSAAKPATRSPAFSAARRAGLPCARSRSIRPTRPPASRTASAMPRAMPPAPPVTAIYPVLKCLHCRIPLFLPGRAGADAAIDNQIRAGDPARRVGGEEQCGIGDVVGTAEPLQRRRRLPAADAFRPALSRCRRGGSGPGQIELTRMPCAPNSSAAALVNISSAALEVA